MKILRASVFWASLLLFPFKGLLQQKKEKKKEKKSKESRSVLINSFVYHLGQWHFVCGPQAWSSIVYQLIPNVKQLEANLTQFGDIIDADEVLLFERATFLVSICYLSGVWHNDDSDNEVCFH